jgi:hypothetical protein
MVARAFRARSPKSEDLAITPNDVHADDMPARVDRSDWTTERLTLALADARRGLFGRTAVKVWFMVLWSLAGGVAAGDLPHWWWPQTSATVLGCEPTLLKFDRPSGHENCTLGWTEGGAYHRGQLGFVVDEHPVGSTLTVAVNGNMAQKPKDIYRITGIAGSFLAGDLALLSLLVVSWRRMRRDIRDLNAALAHRQPAQSQPAVGFEPP